MPTARAAREWPRSAGVRSRSRAPVVGTAAATAAAAAPLWRARACGTSTPACTWTSRVTRVSSNRAHRAPAVAALGRCRRALAPVVPGPAAMPGLQQRRQGWRTPRTPGPTSRMPRTVAWTRTHGRCGRSGRAASPRAWGAPPRSGASQHRSRCRRTLAPSRAAPAVLRAARLDGTRGRAAATTRRAAGAHRRMRKPRSGSRSGVLWSHRRLEVRVRARATRTTAGSPRRLRPRRPPLCRTWPRPQWPRLQRKGPAALA
mmetsp:Transcript_16129/g.35782  ORF Transcript_16129/g.35782 Transcript_16129/m.35782 type:complete len:259 (-) Transcript_16129:799-1575(-)